MTREHPVETTASMEPGRSLPLLIALFAGSGTAALIYEMVWFQLLQLVIGSTAVSVSVLLGSFMGGTCVGSLALSRIISPRHHPLRKLSNADSVTQDYFVPNILAVGEGMNASVAVSETSIGIRNLHVHRCRRLAGW